MWSDDWTATTRDGGRSAQVAYTCTYTDTYTDTSAYPYPYPYP